MARRLSITILALVLAAGSLAPRIARAARCEAGLTNGAHCTCPDYASLLTDPGFPLMKCDPGWTPVVYTLGGSFAPDGSTSSATIRGRAKNSPCAGLEKDVPMSGNIVLCWSPVLPNGCREFRSPFNGVCLDIESQPLGLGCTTPECQAVTTGQLAIGTSGSAAFFACPPTDPATSCRANGVGTEGLFRFQTGGLCNTFECIAGQPTPDACETDWGATYWGFRHNPPGYYDWASGGFKLIVTTRRASCGRLRTCLGTRTNPWTFTTIGNPAPGFLPPCIGGAASACSPAACFQ